MKIHPIASLVPDFTKEEYEALVGDIKQNGQIDPIMTYEGQIIDGRHRFKACQELGIEPKMEPLKLNGCTYPYDYVAAKLQGRNLNAGQKACISVEFYFMANLSKGTTIKEFLSKQRSDKCAHQFHDKKDAYLYISQKKAANKFGAAISYMEYATVLYVDAKPLFLKVKNGEETLMRAFKIHRTYHPSNSKMKLAKSDPYIPPHIAAFSNVPKESLTPVKASPALGRPPLGEKSIAATLDMVEQKKLKIPSPFDSIEVYEIFMRAMSDMGWKFELKFMDKKYYSNFYGNGFTQFRGDTSLMSPTNNYRQAVVQAAFERLSK